MTAPCPEIATYELSSQSRAPKWLAKYVHCGDLLPATFEGATEAEAYDAAVQFWRDEQRAIAKGRIARGERAA
jgi:hypothetical protein